MEKRTLYKEGTYKKGNLHTHTTWSDGMHTPAETAKHYRSKGYDFLALTDHWVYGIHPELNRDDFLVFPGTELDIERRKKGSSSGRFRSAGDKPDTGTLYF